MTEFTFTRYLCPYLCDYQGWSLFLDADILVMCDIFELEKFFDPTKAVMVVKNARKFEWPSLMLFNNALCKKLTPNLIDDKSYNPYAMDWGPIGELPAEYNHCVGYDAPRKDAKIAHFTQGIPCFAEVDGCEYQDEWLNEQGLANYTVSWEEIMGGSVHKKHVMAKHENRDSIAS